MGGDIAVVIRAFCSSRSPSLRARDWRAQANGLNAHVRWPASLRDTYQPTHRRNGPRPPAPTILIPNAVAIPRVSLLHPRAPRTGPSARPPSQQPCLHHHDLRRLDAARSVLGVVALVIVFGAVLILLSDAGLPLKLVLRFLVLCPIAYIVLLFWTARRMNKHRFTISLNADANPPLLHVEYRKGGPSVYPLHDCKLTRGSGESPTGSTDTGWPSARWVSRLCSSPSATRSSSSRPRPRSSSSSDFLRPARRSDSKPTSSARSTC